MLTIFLYLLTVIAPIIIWFWFFIWLDRAEPEPKKLLIFLFFLGVGVAILSIAVEGTFFSIVLPSYYKTMLSEDIGKVSALTVSTFIFYMGGGILEEALKYLTLKEFVYDKVAFNQIGDGVIYAVALALGFVFAENSMYFIELLIHTTKIVFLSSIFVRGILTTLMHITAAGFTGYSLGKMKFSSDHNFVRIIIGLGAAICLHALFNGLIVIPYGIFIAFPLVVSSFGILLWLLNKRESKIIWRLITPQPSSSQQLPNS